MEQQQHSDMFQSYHDKVTNAFKVKDWFELFERAKSHRMSAWEPQARECIKIRENKFGDDSRLPNWNDPFNRMYKENVAWKFNKWLVSANTGQTVVYDLESDVSFRDENTELLEIELNTIASHMDIHQQTAEALYDCLYTGMGYVRLGWNTKKVSTAWETGVPTLEYVPTMKMYIDDTSHLPDKSDVRYFFHVELFDYKDLSKKYPKYAEQFKNKKNDRDLIELVTVQFRIIQDVECVWVTDTAPQLPKKYIYPVSEWTAMIDSGEYAPEGVEISTPFMKETTFWYEAKFFQDIDLVIQKPVYVGERSSYHICHYAPMSDSAYDFGLTYYLMDATHMMMFLTTTLIQQTFRYQKNEKEIVSGALVNEQQYKKEGYKIGVNAWVNPQWALENPHRRAVTMQPLGEFPSGMSMLIQNIKQYLKELSGVTDTVEGVQTHHGQSGVGIAQLQAASKVYHKEEQLKYHRFLNNIGYHLVDLIGEYRDFSHFMDFLDDDNQMTKVLVNDPLNSPYEFETDRVVVYAQVIEHIELLKQMQMERAYANFDRGLLSGFRTLEASGEDNAYRKYEEALQEKGMLEIFKFLQENPDAMQLFQQIMQTGMPEQNAIGMGGGGSEVDVSSMEELQKEQEYVGRHAVPE
jgi:hypothetical protein